MPSSFLPDEDQGYLYINLQLPNAASLQRTDAVARKIEDVLAKTPGVQYTTSVVGFSLLSFVSTSYNGFFFVTLKPWDRAEIARDAIARDQAAHQSRIGAACLKASRFRFRRHRFRASEPREDLRSRWKIARAPILIFLRTMCRHL